MVNINRLIYIVNFTPLVITMYLYVVRWIQSKFCIREGCIIINRLVYYFDVYLNISTIAGISIIENRITSTFFLLFITFYRVRAYLEREQFVIDLQQNKDSLISIVILYNTCIFTST